MSNHDSTLICQLVDQYSVFPQVRAVALGGSRASHFGAADPQSDIDLYVYTTYDIPLDERLNIVEKTGGATRTNIGLNYWGPGDEWYHGPTGIEIDIVYFDASWMDEQIDRVLVRNEASMGYTTCFWHTVNHSKPFADPRDWFYELQKKCKVPYPIDLQHNIIELNHPVLREIIPSYAHQVEKAVIRGDFISINHRLAAFFASYFDILFALNRRTHPGEKRMLDFALNQCQLRPVELKQDVESILFSGIEEINSLPTKLDRLVDHLDELLIREGFSF